MNQRNKNRTVSKSPFFSDTKSVQTTDPPSTLWTWNNPIQIQGEISGTIIDAARISSMALNINTHGEWVFKFDIVYQQAIYLNLYFRFTAWDEDGGHLSHADFETDPLGWNDNRGSVSATYTGQSDPIGVILDEIERWSFIYVGYFY